MRFIYQQWDGSEYPTQDHLAYFQNFMEYVLQFGPDALASLQDLVEDPEQRKLIDQWVEDGLLDKVGVRFRLTPRAIDSLQRQALMEVFRGLKPDGPDGHETLSTGAGSEQLDSIRRYQWGDSVSDMDLGESLRNAVARGGATLPIKLEESDFRVHDTESKASCSTVILLDMSGSMNRWNRFVHAKKCAMAVHALIRQRFAMDSVDVVGFATGAEVIPEQKLPLALPKKVSMFDPVVDITVPITELDSAPQHFTNLQMGLTLARRLLARRGGHNKQVFIITDGQPTAHVEGDRVHLRYPPEDETSVATLSEAILLARQGVRFATFALIEDYYYMDWVSFVDHLTKLTKGVAFYCTGENLSQCIMESYLSGKKTKTFLG